MAFKIEMKQKGMSQLYQQLKRTLDTVNEGYRIKAGVLYPEAYPKRPEVDVAQVAAWQNFGTAGMYPVPPRPFMTYSAMFIERSTRIKQLIKQNQRMQFSIDKQTAHKLGEYAVEIITNTIRRRSLYKPLKPRTVKNKGHDKPLRHTERMMNSIDYSVFKAKQSRRSKSASRSGGRGRARR